jgi:hypothetical protein
MSLFNQTPIRTLAEWAGSINSAGLLKQVDTTRSHQHQSSGGTADHANRMNLLATALRIHDESPSVGEFSAHETLSTIAAPYTVVQRCQLMVGRPRGTIYIRGRHNKQPNPEEVEAFQSVAREHHSCRPVGATRNVRV